MCSSHPAVPVPDVAAVTDWLQHQILVTAALAELSEPQICCRALSGLFIPIKRGAKLIKTLFFPPQGCGWCLATVVEVFQEMKTLVPAQLDLEDFPLENRGQRCILSMFSHLLN